MSTRKKAPASIGGSRNTRAFNPKVRNNSRGPAMQSEIEKALTKKGTHCSADTQELVRTMMDQSFDVTTNLLPSATRPVRHKNGGTTIMLPPMQAKGGVPYESVKYVRVQTGTTPKFGFFSLWPKKIGFSSPNPMLVTSTSSTQTSVGGSPIGAEVTWTRPTLNERAIGASADVGRRCFLLTHLSIRLKVNSESVQNRGGRFYIGHYRGSPVGLTGSVVEGIPSFSQFDLALLQPGNRPTYTHIPDGEINLSTTGDGGFSLSQDGEEYIVGIIEDNTGGQLYELEVTVKGIYYGQQIPFDMETRHSAAAWDCAQSCLTQALPPSRAYLTGAQRAMVSKALHVANQQVITSTPKSLLATSWDMIRKMWAKGGNDLLKYAASSLL